MAKGQMKTNKEAKKPKKDAKKPAAAPTLTVWTSALSRTLPARFLGTKELVADLTATDPLLDAMAFSRGRFATAASGAPMLTVPSAPEVTRVVEDCRS